MPRTVVIQPAGGLIHALYIYPFHIQYSHFVAAKCIFYFILVVHAVFIMWEKTCLLSQFSQLELLQDLVLITVKVKPFAIQQDVCKS